VSERPGVVGGAAGCWADVDELNMQTLAAMASIPNFPRSDMNLTSTMAKRKDGRIHGRGIHETVRASGRRMINERAS
jgi:hypothetical protein